MLKTGEELSIEMFNEGLIDNHIFNINDQETINQINLYAGDRISIIDNTLKMELRNQLIEAFNEGESIREIKQRLKDNVFNSRLDGFALSRIARTESMLAINNATLITFKKKEIPGKEWISTRDARVRDNHLEMDGQVVPINEDFVNLDGEPAAAPGQFGIPEEDIFCRCTIGPNFLIEEKSIKKETKSDYHKRQDQRAEDAEDDLSEVYKNKFEYIQTQLFLLLDNISITLEVM